ncbi:hypothetical protein QR680_011545 [Steinernema hermaphroditum]|uniref:Uncharacterized protein n=1 Tax=Steinernema hermaphroditum TaxID=289476 RepID=A0AA39HYV6_9BILA|nr:hypothetical protein QR680_011545 [Steinernema hermaphroditum]
MSPPTLQDWVIRRHVLTAIQRPSSVLNFGLVIPKFLADQVTTVIDDFENFRKFSSVKVPDEALVVLGGRFNLISTIKQCRKPELSYFQLCVENGLDEEFSDFYMQHTELFQSFPKRIPAIWEAYFVSNWSLSPEVEFTQLMSCCDQCIRHQWNYCLKRILKRAKAELPDRFFDVQQLAFFISLKLEKVESLKVIIEADPSLAEQPSLREEAMDVFADTACGTKMIGFALVASRESSDIFAFLKTFNETLSEFDRELLTRMFSMYSPECEAKEVALEQLRKLLFE